MTIDLETEAVAREENYTALIAALDMTGANDVSGSQLTRYFPNTDSIVVAVIDWQADSVLGFHRAERFTGFDSTEAFQDWADFYVLSGRPFDDRCSLGSFAPQARL